MFEAAGLCGVDEEHYGGGLYLLDFWNLGIAYQLLTHAFRLFQRARSSVSEGRG